MGGGISISIIIPTLNEAENIENSVKQFTQHQQKEYFEVLVVDSGSQDNTPLLAAQAGAKVLNSTLRNRAAQMNLGARHAQHNILYFVHADVKVPHSFYADIVDALLSGKEAGCYRSRFEHYPGLMKVNAFVTRFKWLTARGGDQTLFITKGFFEKLSGFNEAFIIMEDYDIIKRIWENGNSFVILPKEVMISMRKYKNNSWLRVQYANATAMIMFNRGRSAADIKKKYQRLVSPLQTG